MIMEFVIPKSVLIGNRLVLRYDQENEVIYTSSKQIITKKSFVNPFNFTHKFYECRIRDYREATQEILLQLEACNNSENWYKYWLLYNDEWANNLIIKWIFFT